MYFDSIRRLTSVIGLDEQTDEIILVDEVL